MLFLFLEDVEVFIPQEDSGRLSVYRVFFCFCFFLISSHYVSKKAAAHRLEVAFNTLSLDCTLKRFGKRGLTFSARASEINLIRI